MIHCFPSHRGRSVGRRKVTGVRRLTWPQVPAWRMRRQFLLEPEEHGAPAAVARRPAGVQAQVVSAAAQALALCAAVRSWEKPSWTKAFGATPADLEAIAEVAREVLDNRPSRRGRPEGASDGSATAHGADAADVEAPRRPRHHRAQTAGGRSRSPGGSAAGSGRAVR
jgi:hypothetical protein